MSTSRGGRWSIHTSSTHSGWVRNSRAAPLSPSRLINRDQSERSSSTGLARSYRYLGTTAGLSPAIIAFFGDNIDRFRVPFLGRPADEGGGVWGFIFDRVLAWPIIPAVVTIVVLVAIAAPATTLNLGFNGPRSFPEEAEGTKALIALEENFTLGLVQPGVVVVDAGEKQNVFASDIQESVAELLRLVQEDVVSPDNPEALFGSPLHSSNLRSTSRSFFPLHTISILSCWQTGFPRNACLSLQKLLYR